MEDGISAIVRPSVSGFCALMSALGRPSGSDGRQANGEGGPGSKSTDFSTDANTVRAKMTSPRAVAVGVLATALTLLSVAGTAVAATTGPLPSHDSLLEPGEMLALGQSVTSSNGRFRLTLRRDGELALYQDTTMLWRSGTAGEGADRLVMQRNGDLAMYRPLAYGSEPVWRSGSDGFAGAVLSVRDEGGVVIRLGGNPTIWSAALPPPDVGLAGTKHVVYVRGDQMVWLVSADGSLFDSYPVSGRATWPVPGRYEVLSKSLRSQSLSGHVWMEHMVRFVKPAGRAATGFHSIPVTWNGTPIQTVDELGQFRSSGCVRQRNDKAEQLYDWAPIGTPVIVVA